MTNRLRKFLRAMPFCVGFCLLLVPTAWLKAQPDFFNFSYNGPTSLSVGPTCSSMLQGNVPDPVVSSTVGANITMSMFDPAASGFLYSDQFTSGTVAHVFWFVKDDAGHSHTYEYFINFVDNSPPAFDLTGVFDTLQFGGVVEVPAQTAIPITDNCTMVVSDTFYQTSPPDTCQSGTFTRTWVATDANSNTAVFTQTIIIYADTLPPLITGYPINGAAACEQLATAYPLWLANQIAVFAATDASGVLSLTNNAPPVFPAGCKEPYTVRFKAVDNCNIQQNVFVTFITSDLEGPVVIVPPKDTVAYCSQSDNELAKLREWIGAKAYSQVFDSCSYPLTYTMEIDSVLKDSAQVVAAFLASFANGCGTQVVGNQSFNKVHGFISVDFFVKDDCGNETFMGNADFGAIDTLPPVISGVNATEQCGGANDQTALQAWINAHGNATVIDDCSNFSWTNFTFSTSSGQSGSGNFNAGPYPSVQSNNCAWSTDVTFRATDDCGNSSTKSLLWSIEDTLAPTFTGLQPNITVYCPNPLPTVPAAIVSDNCDANVAIAFSRIYKDSLCDGSYTVETTWTATDDCGNSASALQNIFVSDTTKPVFTLIPANKTFRCDTFVLPAIPVMGVDIMATDSCSQVVSITTATNSLQNPNPALCAHYSYNIIRTFTATDSCGNTSTATQTLFVIDNLGPVAGGVLDTTALCSSLAPFPAPIPIATDACSGLTAPPTSTGQTITPGPCTGQYTITVHWVAEDVCGNKSNFDQLVHVIDTVAPTLVNIPPNVTVECNAIPAPPNTSTFNAADNCNSPVAVTLLETEIRNPDPGSCEHWTDYIVKREWTATDNCGNSRTYTQQIQIQDTTPPAIVPPGPVMFPTDLGECGADVTIPAPLAVTDICSNQNFAVILKDTVALVTTIGPGVDSVFFQWTPPNLPPLQPVIGNAVLTIFIDQADVEGPEEYFRVFGENGYQFGITNSAPSQCGSSISFFNISPALLNSWMSDGSLVIALATNNNMGNTIHLGACPGFLNRVRAQVAYSYSRSDVPIDLTYTLDGGASQSFPPSGPSFLSTGTHTVVYTATDCAGNSSSSSVQITVNDTEPPSLLTPANITVFTGQNNCEGTVTLPFPDITENCMMSASLSLASAVMPLQFVVNPDLAGFVPDIIGLTLTGIIPNAVGTGVLTIRHKGDNAQVGEFFDVFDEGSFGLGQTGQGTVLGECLTFFETPIIVTAAQINAWAAGGGNAVFNLVPNTQLGFPDYINNCAPLLPNSTDGMSQVQVTLEYSYAVVDYAVKKPVNQTVATGTLTGNMTTVTLPPANYTVMYTATDNSGLTGMTSFNVTVRDTVKPKAICHPTLTVFANPDGPPPDTLFPVQINNGSTDNCTPTPNLVFALSPSTYTCNQASSDFMVTLTVIDTSGNSATCKSTVRVENVKPRLGYTPVCEGFTLQLLDTIPPASPNTFTYQWMGPNFTSTLQEPVVTNNAMAIHNGIYCVTITGATGCTSFNCLPVSLAILDSIPTLSSNGASFCPGQNVILSTSTYNGQNVSYQWLQDFGGVPTPIGTTMVNNFTVPTLSPGSYTFYVKVFANGCATILSNAVMVTLHPTPPAAVDPNQIPKCEGEIIQLNATTPPTGGLTYQWSHNSSSWTSTAQSPIVTNNAVKATHEGVYTLRTLQNGCLSNPVTVTVTITNKPAKPSISGNVNACAGDTVKLVCNTASAFQWIWTSPPPLYQSFSTDVNVLEIPNASSAHEGGWTVVVVVAGCPSDESNPIIVDVQEYPIIAASSNAPICQDSLLRLMADYISVDPIVSWLWTDPNGIPLGNTQDQTVQNGASGTYQVLGATSYGCADTDTEDVTNVVAPIITFIDNTAPLCCDGTSDTLWSIVVSAHLPLSYQWTGPGMPPFSSTDSMPVIGDVCVGDNGQYMLVVKDTFGCPSLPLSTGIAIQDPPETPDLMVDDDKVCTGDSVLLFFNNTTPGATYTWNFPGGGDTTTSVSFLKLTNLQPIHSGAYSVFATSANGVCSSGANAVNVTIFPIPPAPSISSNSPVCEGAVLMLSSNTIPGVTNYPWTGPFGAIPPIQNPVLMPVVTGMAGEYTLQVSLNGCTSPISTLTVEVVQTPVRPQIQTPTPPICIDGPITQHLNITNWVDQMEYTWIHINSGDTVQGPSTATGLFLGMPNILALGPGEHMFSVIATTSAVPGCSSQMSIAVTVEFDTIPAGVNAFAGLDHAACVDSAILLTGSPNPLMGTVEGMWTQIGGPDTTIYDATTPNAWFWGLPGNSYTFRWSLTNGACQDFSFDEVTIMAQSPEIAQGGSDIFSCETTGIQLNATQGMTVQGSWVQEGSQEGLGIVIDYPLNPNTTISGDIVSGMNYVFHWEIENPGCGKSSDRVDVYVFSGKPSAGPVQTFCDDENCTELSASQFADFETGVWSSNDPGLIFQDSNARITTVCGLKEGKNEIYWEINDGVCGDQSRDTLEVYYGITPTANNDVVSVPFGGTAEFNVLQNDVLPTAYSFAIAIPPVQGSLIDTLGTGIFIYRPKSGFTGSETMTYTILNNLCPSSSFSIGTVTFVVGEAPACFIPSIITPNSDGFNDQFTIPSVCTIGEGGEELDVTIFNQWGDLVFHEKPYQNNWAGTYNSEDLPAGTYFYVVKLYDTDKPRTGFLLIQR